MQQQTRATCWGIATLISWSTMAIVNVYLKSIPAFEIVMITFGILFIAASIRLTITKRWYLAKQHWVMWLIGVVGIAGNYIAYVTAFKYAPPVHVDLITYLWPLCVLAFSLFLPNEKFRWRHLIACLIAFFGIFLLLTNGKGSSGFQWKYLTGYLLAFFDAVVWAIFIVGSRYFGEVPSDVIGMFAGIITFFCACMHFIFEPTIAPSTSQWGLLIFTGLFTGGFAYYAWDYAVKQGHYKFLSVLSYGTPILSAGWLLAFHQVALTPVLAIAVILVAAAGCIGAC